MLPKTIQQELDKIQRCCRKNCCDIVIINGEIDSIQEVISDHEARITILEGGFTQTIHVVANYGALPDPTTVNGQFYYAQSSQGTKWLPGTIGGTYYPNGFYYSNGAAWIMDELPWNANQATVDGGVDEEAFVTSKTLANATTVSHPGHTHTSADISDLSSNVVTSLSKSGSTQLVGDVTLSAGANITLTQVGQDIEIESTGGGGGTDSIVYAIALG